MKTKTMSRTMLKPMPLTAAAVAAVLAVFFSANVNASPKAGAPYVNSNVAATGDALLLRTASGRGYYQPARCLSINGALRKLNREGFHSFGKVKARTNRFKVRAVYRGQYMQLKVDRCSGNVVWYRPIYE